MEHGTPGWLCGHRLCCSSYEYHRKYPKVEIHDENPGQHQWGQGSRDSLQPQPLLESPKDKVKVQDCLTAEPVYVLQDQHNSCLWNWHTLCSWEKHSLAWKPFDSSFHKQGEIPCRSLYNLYPMVQMKGKSSVNLFKNSIQELNRWETQRTQSHTGSSWTQLSQHRAWDYHRRGIYSCTQCWTVSFPDAPVL